MIPVTYVKGSREEIDVWYYFTPYRQALAKRGPLKGQHTHNWTRWRINVLPTSGILTLKRYFVRSCVRGGQVKHKEVWNTSAGRSVTLQGSGMTYFKQE